MIVVKLAVAAFMLLHQVHVARGGEMTLNQLRQEFERRKRLQWPCLYNGMWCKKDLQYCSPRKSVCQDFFKNGTNESAKIQECRELLGKPDSDIEPGPFDVCITFLGTLSNRNAIQPGGVTVAELMKMFQERRPMEQPCLYNGETCHLERQYCNATSKKCEDLFSEGSTDAEKIQTCRNLLQVENDTDPGPYDVCMFFLGTLTNDKVIQPGGITVVELQEKFQKRKPMEQPCIFNGEYCHLDRQFCNSTSRKCEDIFPGEADETQKKRICEAVLEQDDPEPGPFDVCRYFLGTLPRHTDDGTSNREIALSVSLGVLVLVGLVVGVLVWAYRKKHWCFKVKKQKGKKDRSRSDPDDVFLRTSNLE